jgi:hypothetical protein
MDVRLRGHDMNGKIGWLKKTWQATLTFDIGNSLTYKLFNFFLLWLCVLCASTVNIVLISPCRLCPPRPRQRIQAKGPETTLIPFCFTLSGKNAYICSVTGRTALRRGGTGRVHCVDFLTCIIIVVIPPLNVAVWLLSISLNRIIIPVVVLPGRA